MLFLVINVTNKDSGKRKQDNFKPNKSTFSFLFLNFGRFTQSVSRIQVQTN